MAHHGFTLTVHVPCFGYQFRVSLCFNGKYLPKLTDSTSATHAELKFRVRGIQVVLDIVYVLGVFRQEILHKLVFVPEPAGLTSFHVKGLNKMFPLVGVNNLLERMSAQVS